MDVILALLLTIAVYGTFGFFFLRFLNSEWRKLNGWDKKDK